MIPPLLALFSYPLVAMVLFSRMPLRAAVIWTLIVGYLFLPPQIRFNLPMLPSLTKNTVPALSVLLCLALFGGRPASGLPERPGMLPRHLLILALLALVLFSGFLTVLTNGDRQIFGPTVLPGLRIYDGFSSSLGTIMMLLPLLIGRKYLADSESHKQLLKCLALAAAAYTLPIIFELVMSPQLNRIVYGYFPSGWRQHLRGDGYRPLVFLKHGLWLGIFICCAFLASIAYIRSAEPGRRVFYALLAGWLFVILLASKVLGAFSIAVILTPVLLFLGARTQLLVAATIAGSLLIYPTLRGADVVPVYQIADLAERIDPRRAGSLRYRLINEDMLLARANNRPLFGWGGYNRARVFDEKGNDQSTTDGFWVIRIGEKGWAGYFGLFGLLTCPILLLALRRRQEISLATSGLCVVLAANLVDLIPNAGLTSVTWLIAGALVGRLEHQGAEKETDTPSAANAPRGASGYSRFGPSGALSDPRLSRPGPLQSGTSS